MRRLVAAGLLAALLCGTASCSNSKNTASPTKSASATVAAVAPVAASQPPGGNLAVSGTAAITAQGAAGTSSAAVEDRLMAAALQKADLPSELEPSNKQPWSNRDYAKGQPDEAAFQQKLDAEGRISGVVVQFLAMATAQANAPQMAGLVDLLSTWTTETNAIAGLADTLKSVTPQATQPNAVKTDRESVDLGRIGDQVITTHLHVTPLTPGLPPSDAYIVGLRKGKDTAIMILTGQSGAPSLDTVKRLVSLQAQRLG